MTPVWLASQMHKIRGADYHTCRFLFEFEYHLKLFLSQNTLSAKGVRTEVTHHEISEQSFQYLQISVTRLGKSGMRRDHYSHHTIVAWYGSRLSCVVTTVKHFFVRLLVSWLIGIQSQTAGWLSMGRMRDKSLLSKNLHKNPCYISQRVLWSHVWLDMVIYVHNILERVDTTWARKNILDRSGFRINIIQDS